MNEKIVITGISLITSLGLNLNDNIINLHKGRSGITNIESFELKGISSCIGGEIKEFKDIKKNKWQLIFDMLIDNLIKDGFLKYNMLKKSVLSAGSSFFGIENNNYRSVKNTINNTIKKYKINSDNMIINSNTCAAGNFAVFSGASSIINNLTDISVCLGIDILSPYLFSGFDSLKSLSRSYPRPFSLKRDGLALGEGGAVLILERYSHAVKRKADIFCEYGGFGASNDINGLTAMDKTLSGIFQCYKKAVKNAKTNKNNIDYILAHATGTRLNDAVEGQSILKFFDHSPTIGFFKNNFGHTMGASALIESVLLSYMIKKGIIIKNNVIKQPEFKFNYLKTNAKRQILCAMNNAFGFGGINSSLILKNFK